jgi:REDY-like protein HapK
MTTTIIVLFNLKPEIAVADYEAWARDIDIPGVRAIPAVSDYQVRRVTGLFGSDDQPPYQYVERIEISGMDPFLADIADERVQAVIAQFNDHAANPVFLLSEPF